MAEPRRLLLVGAGNVVRFWMPTLLARADVELVGIVEPDAARAEALVATHGLACPVVPSLADAVHAVGVDLVVNATPPHLHRAVTEEALALGCDVFTEKPLAPELADALALVEAARRAGRLLVVMQNRRHHPAVRALRDAVAAGRIGAPLLASCDMLLAPHFPMPFVNAMAHPLLVDMAIHSFDQARFVTGLEPVAVHCASRHPAHSWYAGDALAVATFELAGGALFSYRGAYVAPGLPTSFDGAWRVSGAAGAATWDGSADEVVVERVVAGARDGLYDPVERARVAVPPPRDGTGHAAAIDAVLDALAAGATPDTVAADNVRSLAMSHAARLSAAEGRVVPLAELGLPA